MLDQSARAFARALLSLLADSMLDKLNDKYDQHYRVLITAKTIGRSVQITSRKPRQTAATIALMHCQQQCTRSQLDGMPTRYNHTAVEIELRIVYLPIAQCACV